MQFYILMIDYGRKRADQDGPVGFEAIADPELTRRAIVEQAREVLKEGRHQIAFVKFVDGNFIEDCTDEIIAEANADDPRLPLSPAEVQAAAFDRARALRNEAR